MAKSLTGIFTVNAPKKNSNQYKETTQEGQPDVMRTAYVQKEALAAIGAKDGDKLFITISTEDPRIAKKTK